jgi:hypothetical protein
LVEPVPDRYVLQPNDELVIEAEYRVGDEPFLVDAYDGGLCITASIWPTGVWINGKPATPDWDFPGPNSSRAAPEGE